MNQQILIVEDDPGSREALTTVLRDEGYIVTALDSASEALDYLHRSQRLPQLIVLDLMMPGLDGWDFRHAQKADPKLAAIPVIAMSAGGKLPDADASFRKPLDYQEFLNAVERHVGPAPGRTKPTTKAPRQRS
jgi:CheY-like chemotaxis protein